MNLVATSHKTSLIPQMLSLIAIIVMKTNDWLFIEFTTTDQYSTTNDLVTKYTYIYTYYVYDIKDTTVYIYIHIYTYTYVYMHI